MHYFLILKESVMRLQIFLRKETFLWDYLLLLALLGSRLFGSLLLCQDTLENLGIVGGNKVHALQIHMMTQILLTIHTPHVHLHSQLLGFLEPFGMFYKHLLL